MDDVSKVWSYLIFYHVRHLWYDTVVVVSPVSWTIKKNNTEIYRYCRRCFGKTNATMIWYSIVLYYSTQFTTLCFWGWLIYSSMINSKYKHYSLEFAILSSIYLKFQFVDREDIIQQTRLSLANSSYWACFTKRNLTVQYCVVHFVWMVLYHTVQWYHYISIRWYKTIVQYHCLVLYQNITIHIEFDATYWPVLYRMSTMCPP